jgi:RNA polymerase sigma-70 factor (ECF subfamily)
MSSPTNDATPDDTALIARLREGDPSALEAVMRMYAARLIQYASRWVDSADRADEVVQDVFFALWRDRAALPITRDVAAYLFWRTRNHALDVARADRAAHDRDGRWSVEMHGQYVADVTPGESAIEAAERERAIRTALAGVSPRCREVFGLIWDKHLSYAEVAEVLGIAIPSVRSQMSRALKHLFAALGSEADRPPPDPV